MKSILKQITTGNIYLSDQKLNTVFECPYNKKAIDFLISTNTTCDIVEIGLDKPRWGKSLVNKYRVTLENKNHSYTFYFWDSIKNTENNISAVYKFYNILACLDSNVDDSFDNFCASYGYEFKNETEYIETKSTHLLCLEQAKNLKKLFDNSQFNLLCDVK